MNERGVVQRPGQLLHPLNAATEIGYQTGGERPLVSLHRDTERHPFGKPPKIATVAGECHRWVQRNGSHAGSRRRLENVESVRTGGVHDDLAWLECSGLRQAPHERAEGVIWHCDDH